MSLSDRLYLRFDGLLGDREILKAAEKVSGKRLGDIYISKSRWNAYIWREEMLRMLDGVKPKIVLCPDEDEEFGHGIKKDMKNFVASKKPQMAFNYEFPMPSIEGGYRWRGKPLPCRPHVKVYRWRPGLTFLPYQGRGRLSNYSKKKYVVGKSKIRHYCFYTPELRDAKVVNTKNKKRWIKQELRKERNEAITAQGSGADRPQSE
jgi:hypothetical protein